MFWFLNQVLGALIAGILYPLLITAPLHILNGIYQAFSFCCGVNLADILFGSPDGQVVINVASPLFRYLVTAIIISLVLMVVFIVALVIETLVTKKKVNFLSKVKWPLLAITSTVTVPIAFILISSLASVLMRLVGGTSTRFFIEAAYVSEVCANLTTGIDNLAHSFNINIKLIDKDGQIIVASVQQAFDLLQKAVIEIQKEAAKGNLQDLVDKCSRAIEYLGNCRTTFTTIAEIKKQFASIATYISTNVKDGYVVAKTEIANQLREVVGKITTMQNSWSSCLTGFGDIFKQAQSYGFALLENTVKVDNIEVVIKELLKDFEAIANDPWRIDNNVWAEFNTYWINGNSKEQVCLLNVLMNGGSWKGDVGAGEITYTVDGAHACFNHIIVAIDPTECNTFNLVVKIYQIVTGNSDANWAATMPWNMSKGVSLINVGVGFIIIVGAIFVCGLFGLMAARRLIELAVLAVWSIIAAMMGIKDDGAKFNNTVKLIIVKMFCIVIAWAAFSLSINILDVISNAIGKAPGIDQTSLAFGAVTAIVMVGGLLGAYHMSMLLQQWMGDSTSLQGTIADMGAMGTMMGAGKLVGMAALGSKVALTGGKKAVGNIVSGKANVKNNKIWQAAEKAGIGHRTYSLDRRGRMQVSGFELKGKSASELKNSQNGLNALMKNKSAWKNEKFVSVSQQARSDKKMEKILSNNKLLEKQQGKEMSAIQKALEKMERGKK